MNKQPQQWPVSSLSAIYKTIETNGGGRYWYGVAPNNQCCLPLSKLHRRIRSPAHGPNSEVPRLMRGAQCEWVSTVVSCCATSLVPEQLSARGARRVWETRWGYGERENRGQSVAMAGTQQVSNNEKASTLHQERVVPRITSFPRFDFSRSSDFVDLEEPGKCEEVDSTSQGLHIS